MNNKENNGRVIPPASKRQWQLFQQVAEFGKELNRLPDAREVRRDKNQSAPQNLLELIF